MVTEVIYWYSSSWPLALSSVYFAQVRLLTKNVQFSPNIKSWQIFFFKFFSGKKKVTSLRGEIAIIFSNFDTAI